MANQMVEWQVATDGHAGDYCYSSNLHTVQGALAALSTLLTPKVPTSLLDVGCGTGTWLRAACELGVEYTVGVDGIALAEHQLHVPKNRINQHDLTTPFYLGRRFDVVLCLEVAEHLPEKAASILISSLVAHSDAILFSAACPKQPGQHHVNCQWPKYWQDHFNDYGFVCDDSVRWAIWEDQRIEPWYRQNMFWARRDPFKARLEPRIRCAVHPELVDALRYRESVVAQAVLEEVNRIERGSKPLSWYFRAAFAKLIRRLT
jgi:SAM-dependent methyltransferase